jgi:ParB/RepB/Spo0J family partition protein
MPYQEIPLDLIDSSPFQTRKELDKDTVISLMASAMDGLGIRNAPLVRPTDNGRYQIASGHYRIEAWKALERETIMCKVEEMTDSQMKKEIIVENVNRADLKEEEQFQAIEQYRIDPDTTDEKIKKKLLNKERGWIAELSRQTGLPEITLNQIYDVIYIRDLLVLSRKDFEKQPSHYVIRSTRGLPEEERVKLVVKAVDREWSGEVTQKIRKAIKEMKPKVRELILDEATILSPKLIEAISEIKDSGMQTQVIDRIKMLDYGEKMSLKLVERAKEGKLDLDLKIVDEAEDELKKLTRAYDILMGWGVNQYMIIGTKRWNEEVLQMIRGLEQKLLELKMLHNKLTGKGVIDVEQAG